MNKIALSIVISFISCNGILAMEQPKKPTYAEIAHAKALDGALKKLDAAVIVVKEKFDNMATGKKRNRELDRLAPAKKMDHLRSCKKELLSICDAINKVEEAKREGDLIEQTKNLSQLKQVQVSRHQKELDKLHLNKQTVIIDVEKVNADLRVLKAGNNPQNTQNIFALEQSKINLQRTLSMIYAQEAKMRSRILREDTNKLNISDKFDDASYYVRESLSHHETGVKRAGIITGLLAVTGICLAGHRKFNKKKSLEPVK